VADLSGLSYAQRIAWNRYQAGEAVPMSQLPLNGQHCPEQTIGGVDCGHPLLIDGSCPNAYMHGEPEIEVTDAMVDAAHAVYRQAYDSWRHTGQGPDIRVTLHDAIAAALKAQEDEQS